MLSFFRRLREFLAERSYRRKFSRRPYALVLRFRKEESPPRLEAESVGPLRWDGKCYRDPAGRDVAPAKGWFKGYPDCPAPEGRSKEFALDDPDAGMLLVFSNQWDASHFLRGFDVGLGAQRTLDALWKKTRAEGDAAATPEA